MSLRLNLIGHPERRTLREARAELNYLARLAEADDRTRGIFAVIGTPVYRRASARSFDAVIAVSEAQLHRNARRWRPQPGLTLAHLQRDLARAREVQA
jgi:hypothetical protein